LIAQNPPVTLPLALGLGICTFVFPFLLYTFALRELPAGTASALGIIEPMAATVFSVLILEEPLSLPSGIGIVLVLISVVLLGVAENTVKEK
jgi:drug/metabolite transporter (DMT)-like permease